MRPCFTFKAKAGNKPAVLALDQEIGFWGTQAKDFRASLDSVADAEELTVEINSPGGEVMAGLGMYNMLRNAAARGVKVNTRVTGVAASIASVIALAGDKREMPKNSFAMIHGVSGMTWGTADEIREYAETVDKMNASIRNIYVERMGVEEAKAAEIMSKDTWLTAEEAKDMGFATDLTDAVEATAKFDMERADLPEQVRSVFKAKVDGGPADDEEDPDSSVVPDTPVAEQIVALAKGAGFEAHAAFFAVSFDDVEKAKARIGVAREISALCNVAGKPDMAAAAIRSNKTLAEVRGELVNALAETDQHVDNHAPQPNGQTAGNTEQPADVSPTALWAAHNAQMKKGR